MGLGFRFYSLMQSPLRTLLFILLVFRNKNSYTNKINNKGLYAFTAYSLHQNEQSFDYYRI
jgi:hypothetical protein